MNIHMDEDDEISLTGCLHWTRERFFTREKLKRRLPLLTWINNYSLKDLHGDLIAGISVAFTILPQGLALSLLAGLPPQYGLYSSFVGCFVYAIFGTCKDVAFGPTSIQAILLAPFVTLGGTVYAILLSLYIGCAMLVLGILNLGFVVDFVSFPVLSSFSTAAAITIACSQMKSFFGLHLKSSKFFPTIVEIITNLNCANPYDTCLGIFCLIFIIPLQRYKHLTFANDYDKSALKRWLNRIWWFLVTGRNAIVVIICASLATISNGFTINKDIAQGLPPFRVPRFDYVGDDGQQLTAGQVASDLAPGIVVMTLVGLLETVAVAKTFMADKKFDATQELIALGLSNIAASFFSAFPATGSFSRSAVNHNSGVRTQLAGVFTGCLVILAMVTLAPYFRYIPKAALASIIIAAVLPMIKFDDIMIVWRANPIDIVPYFLTLSTCLLIDLEYGIVVGVIFSLCILLYMMARPKLTIVLRKTPTGESFLYVKPDRSVLFPSIEYMKVKIAKAILISDVETNNNFAIVIDGEHMFRTDSTFGMVSLVIK